MACPEYKSGSSFRETPEYTAVRQCTPMLIDTLKSSIASVGDELFARGILPNDVRDSIQESKTKSEAVRNLVSWLSDLLKHNPSVYHQFVAVLRELGQWTTPIVDGLATCYQIHSTSQQLSTTAPNTDNKLPKLRMEFSVPHGIPSEVISILSSIKVSILLQDQNESQTVIELPLKVEGGPQVEDGKEHYVAACGRDIAVIVSNVPASSEVIPRRTREPVTQQEITKLEAEGIHKDFCGSDFTIMRARYELLKEHTMIELVRAEQVSCEEFKQQVKRQMITTNKEGVGLHYIGAGQKDTGDWCFTDGFVSFKELMSIYSECFMNRVLAIVSDCSYSGNWVKQAMAYMDGKGVGPCGHDAKEKGYLVKVYASSLANEIPAELAFSIHCTKTDKESAIMKFSNLNINSCRKNLLPVHADQHPIGLNMVRVRCKNKLIHEQCTMAPGSNWEQWQNRFKVVPVKGKDGYLPVWHYFKLTDIEKAIAFWKAAKFGHVNLTHFGEILKSGWGKDVPEDVQKEISQEYFVNYNYMPI